MSDLFRFLLSLLSAGWNWVLSWSWWELCMLIPGVLAVVFLSIHGGIVVEAISRFVEKLAKLVQNLLALSSASIQLLLAGALLVFLLMVGMHTYAPNQSTPLSDGATRVPDFAVSLPGASDESGSSSAPNKSEIDGASDQSGRSTETPSNKTEINARIDLKRFEFIYLQAEPSVNANEVTRIYDRKMRFVAIGKSHDDQWIFVRLKDRTEGWIQREFIVANQSLDLLAVREP